MGRVDFLRRHNLSEVLRTKYVQTEAKTSETEAFEQAWVGEAQRQGLARKPDRAVEHLARIRRRQAAA